MIRHLWDEHRLILDGRRVRDPWAVIDDWIIEYRATGDAELLERCRLRGVQLDPEGGLHRVHRLLLRTGAGDAEARRDLIAEAPRAPRLALPVVLRTGPAAARGGAAADQPPARPTLRGRLRGGYTG